MRVAIVNDLKLAVEALKRTIAQAPGCSVAWIAADGADAVARCAADRPDLILMDIVMPVMDGVEATRRIMAATPCPILVVTSTLDGNLERVYNALGAGALDAVQGPAFAAGGALEGAAGVLRRIRTLQRLAGVGAPSTAANVPPVIEPVAPGPAGARGRAGASEPRPSSRPPGPPTRSSVPMLALGASTGGPEALRAVLGGLAPAFAPPIVIVQHLDVEFVPGFCGWLAAQTGRVVRPAMQGEVPEPGIVLVAASRDHLVLGPDGALRYVQEPLDQPYRPSVDVFFESLARHATRPGAAALLTGMGRDGAAGLLALKKAGWRTFSQDEATSVVYGMPRAARDLGAALEVLPVTALAAALEASMARRAAPVPPAESR